MKMSGCLSLAGNVPDNYLSHNLDWRNALVWDKAGPAFCEKAAKAFSMKMEVE